MTSPVEQDVSWAKGILLDSWYCAGKGCIFTHASIPDKCPECGEREIYPRRMWVADELYLPALNLMQQITLLISESEGVAGLHKNGDVANWEELLENEWLDALPKIQERLNQERKFHESRGPTAKK